MGSRNMMGSALAVAGASVAVAAFASAPAMARTQAHAASGGVASIEKLVPASIKSKGVLTVASDATYAPDEFIGSNGKTVIGMDADLMDAIGQAMGLKVTISNVTFDAIIPAMVAGRFTVGASSFTDTAAREKTVNFVDYANVGESFYTLAHGGTSIKSISDICGLTVSVEAGTTELDDAQAQGKVCSKAGKKPVKVSSFPTQSQANLAVSSGRAQLGFADSPVAAYQVKQSAGKFKLVGATYAKAPYGLAVSKSSKLAPAIKAALLYLMKNGTYTKIFTKWGVESIAVGPSFVKIT